jgi:hypothetical protein
MKKITANELQSLLGGAKGDVAVLDYCSYLQYIVAEHKAYEDAAAEDAWWDAWCDAYEKCAESRP